jgi:AcrR family transcriptional regulator
VTSPDPASTPIWARSTPRRRPALTREEIVAAALGIANAEGLEAVSMRRVAARLGVGAMALYTHVDSKDDLLDLMIDALAEEVLLDDGEFTGDWRESITKVARRERAMMKQHPWVSELVGRRTMIGPKALLHIEQSLRALDGLDVSPATAAQVINAVDQYTIGYVLRETPKAPLQAFAHDSPTGAYLREAAAAGGHERLARLLDDHTADLPGHEESFEQGLRWLLEGIARAITPGRRT